MLWSNACWIGPEVEITRRGHKHVPSDGSASDSGAYVDADKRVNTVMIDYNQPDLTQHPPRSPRARLGGFAHLPRLLDKARAFAAGKQGLYEYGAMMDRLFFTFSGIDATRFLEEVKKGRSDSEMLSWVLAEMRPSRQCFEVEQWSSWLETVGPATAKSHAWIAGKIEDNGPSRDDIRTFFEHLDLDDYTSFGGRS
jgi:hypothetical protein